MIQGYEAKLCSIAHFHIFIVFAKIFVRGCSTSTKITGLTYFAGRTSMQSAAGIFLNQHVLVISAC